MSFITFNLEEIKQEQIINSSELMTIVPAVITETKQPTRILLLKYNGNLEKFVFTMYPSEKSNESLFSGKVKITDLKGNLKIGFIYKEGYLTHCFLQNKNLKKEKNFNIIYKNKEVADNDMPPDGLLETITVTADNPYPNMIHLLLLLEQGIPDNNGTGTSGSSESNAEHWDFTHGGGSPTPNSEIDKLIKGSGNLTADQLRKLKELIDQFKDLNCLTESIYNYFINNNIKLEFNIDPTAETIGGYSALYKRINFKTEGLINYSVLEEELIHAYQDQTYPGGTYQYFDNAQANIEFEAKFLAHINAPYCCSMFKEKNVPAALTQEFVELVEGVKETGNLQELKNKYIYWLMQFKKYNPGYENTKIDESLEPLMLEKLFELSGCY